MLSHLNVSKDPESCLCFWCSFVYLWILSLHKKFHYPLSYSSKLVLKAFRQLNWRLSLSTNLPPTCPLRLVIRNNTSPPHLTVAAGTELAGASYSRLVIIAHLMKELYKLRCPSSLTPYCRIRCSPIVQDSPLLPPVGVWVVSQSQCG